MKKVLTILLCSFAYIAHSQTMPCMMCGGSGMMVQVTGCDMYGRPTYIYTTCSICLGQGYMYVADYSSPGSYSAPSSTSQEVAQPSRTVSQRSCSHCEGRGQYKCACVDTPTFGQTFYHQCPECGQSHQFGRLHKCTCRRCDGAGKL